MTLVSWRSRCLSGSKRFIKAISAIAVIHGIAGVSATAECLVRENALGNKEYRCEGDKIGQLRQDSLGYWQDSESETTYRKTPLGNIESSEGTTFRKDSLGRYRGDDGTVWRQDALGNWTSSGKRD